MVYFVFESLKTRNRFYYKTQSSRPADDIGSLTTRKLMVKKIAKWIYDGHTVDVSLVNSQGSITFTLPYSQNDIITINNKLVTFMQCDEPRINNFISEVNFAVDVCKQPIENKECIA